MSFSRRFILGTPLLKPYNIRDARTVPLEKQKPIQLNVENERFKLNLNIYYDDNVVSVSKVVMWYDPVIKDGMLKKETISYIIDDYEI